MRVNETMGRVRRATAIATALTVGAMLLMAAAASSAGADTSWLCKPGQADNPCLGPMDGTTLPPPGQQAKPLGYAAAQNPPVDCFYIYPTQSKQTTDNATLAADPEIKAVAVNQARQFSRVCNVYAPLYRQYTLDGLDHVTPEMNEIAYSGVVSAWYDYLQNYNHGRGVIIIGHSQGSSHLMRLIKYQIDQDPSVRSRLISAILPGANVYVPDGAEVGGQFQNIPACQVEDQLGCVIAYSSYRAQPGPGADFGRLDSGYWVSPDARPDPAANHVLCVNPATLSGDGGKMLPLANLAAFTGTAEGAKPWLAEPDYYSSQCMHAADGSVNVDWLNVAKTAAPDDTRPDMADLIASGDNLHVGDINLFLDNLVEIAKSEADHYMQLHPIASAPSVPGIKIDDPRAGLIEQRKETRTKLRAALKKARRAKRHCRAAKRVSSRSARGKRRLVRKRCHPIKRRQATVKRLRRQIKRLDGAIANA